MIALSSKDLRARRRAHQHHERTIDEPAPAAYDSYDTTLEAVREALTEKPT
jgi:hypothetical protein